MPVLKSLLFTALPKAGNDPVQLRRAKFVGRLEEQKLLLKDPNHVRTVQRWAKVDGERQAVTKQQAVRPWWKTDPSGQVVMSVKFGARPIEFERGKAGIVVPSKDKLPAVIDTVIAAVRAGELDELFSQAAKTGRSGRHARRLDHQRAGVEVCLRRRTDRSSSVYLLGTQILILAPPPGASAISIEPLCCRSTMPAAIASPRPVPPVERLREDSAR